jgi:hypothetical protein
MDQYGSFGNGHVEVVVVVAGDGEVPHPSVVLLRRGAADDDRDGAVSCLEMRVFSIVCSQESTGADNPASDAPCSAPTPPSAAASKKSATTS